MENEMPKTNKTLDLNDDKETAGGEGEREREKRTNKRTTQSNQLDNQMKDKISGWVMSWMSVCVGGWWKRKRCIWTLISWSRYLQMNTKEKYEGEEAEVNTYPMYSVIYTMYITHEYELCESNLNKKPKQQKNGFRVWRTKSNERRIVTSFKKKKTPENQHKFN